MKVIWLQDVAKIGNRFEVVEVPNGYALNKLLPQGLAENASPENIKKVQARAAKKKADVSKTTARFADAVQAIKDKTATIKAEVNEQGHMFEALKASAVVSALTAVGADITEHEVVIENPIKEVGAHTIVLKEGDESVSITVEVVAA